MNAELLLCDDFFISSVSNSCLFIYIHSAVKILTVHPRSVDRRVGLGSERERGREGGPRGLRYLYGGAVRIGYIHG
jgi:hypothetical protein